MFDRNHSEPKYWKALLVSAPFAVVAMLFIRALIHMTDLVWFAITVPVALVFGWTIYGRAANDWRTGDAVKRMRRR
jgi:hypothetical protein